MRRATPIELLHPFADRALPDFECIEPATLALAAKGLLVRTADIPLTLRRPSDTLRRRPVGEVGQATTGCCPKVRQA